MSSALFSLADALILFSCMKKKFAGISIEKPILLFVLFVMSAGAFLSLSKNTEGYYDYSDDYYTHKPYTANVIAGEWLPQTVTDVEAIVEESGQLLSDTGETLNFERIKNAISVTIEKDYAYVDVPFIYYKGYSAYLEKEDGTKTELLITGEGNNGFCRVLLGDQICGNLVVVYDGTFAQGFAVGFFIVAVVVLTGVVLLRNRKFLKKRREAAE